MDSEQYMKDNKAQTLADFKRLVARDYRDMFVPLNSLGDISIVEYLCQDNLERLYDVVGLLRRMDG